MNTSFRSWAIVLLAFLLGSLNVVAAVLAEGDAVPAISAKDQHGTAYVLTNGTAHLLVAVEMEAAKTANQKLAEQGAGYLDKHRAAYLMDIHSMPRIARVFALPKMRKYPHRIVLIETVGALNWAPVKPGHITLLSLNPAGHVEKITYWKPDTEPLAGLFK